MRDRSPRGALVVEERIRPLALALIHKDGKILVEEGRDNFKQESFFRLLGGSIEFGERGAEAVQRELREELGVESEVNRLVATVENLFTYGGQSCHELILVYVCTLLDNRLYSLDEWEAEESNQHGVLTHKVSWKDLGSFRTGRELFYPDGLPALLDDLL